MPPMAANDIWLAGYYRLVVVCHCDIQPLAAIRQPEKKRAGNGVGGLMTGHELPWGDGVVRRDHAASEALGDRVCGEVEVSEHLI